MFNLLLRFVFMIFINAVFSVTLNSLPFGIILFFIMKVEASCDYYEASRYIYYQRYISFFIRYLA